MAIRYEGDTTGERDLELLDNTQAWHSKSPYHVEAKVSRAFGTSMEVFIDVWIETQDGTSREKVNEAIYTFVAVSKAGKPVEVPPVQPETELEQTRFDGALRRRQLSLILAGKLTPDKATELKALFS